MSATEPNRPEVPPNRDELALAPTQALRPDEPSSQLVVLLDNYLAELQAGRQPDRAKLLAEHPELAAQLENCLSGIEFIHRASAPATKSGMPTQLGDFRIVREVGRGGMGVVYEAEQISLKRRVALKVLRFGAASDSEAMQRFQREAETVAGLHHTNIVPIFAIGCEQGVNYYAMQFIEGLSLSAECGVRNAECADSHSALRTPNSALEIANYGLQAAEALAHAHQRGVIHRDIKPSNLILDPDGRIWLTDFGLAKRMDDVSLSIAGTVLGTPRYMSPEQAAATKNPVDHRTDIYSLGATLYELATGRPLFEADSPHAVITQILTSEPPRPRVVCPNLPRDFETIILKCLAKEPSQRYATAQALAEDLRAFVEGRAIRARRATLAEQAARWFKQQKRSVGVAAVAVAATVFVVIGSLIAWQMHSQARLGYLTLETPRDGNERAEVAEVLTLNDEPVGSPFTLPTKEPLALPEGAFRLRLTAPSKVSQDYLFDVSAGQQMKFDVGLVNETVGVALPLKSPVGVEVTSFNRNANGVRASGQPSPPTPMALGLNESKLFVGPQHLSKPTMRCFSANAQLGWKPDGTRETEVAPMFTADWRLEAPNIVSFLKLPEDKEAWNVLPAQTDVFAWQQVLAWFDPYWWRNGTPPRVMQSLRDLNGDGAEDVIWIAPRLAQPQNNAFGPGPLTPKAAVLIAASGKDGQPLWWFRPQEDGGAAGLMTDPVWIAGDGSRTRESSDRSLTTSATEGASSDGVLVCALRSLNSPKKWLEAIDTRTGESLWRFDVPLAGGPIQQPLLFWASLEAVRPRGESSRPFVLAAVSRFLVAVDVTTGKPLWEPHDLGEGLQRVPRLIDLDGDGMEEVLSVVSRDGGLPQLSSMSLADRKPMWSAPLSWFPNSSLSAWPDVVDFDDDGRSEILLPNNETRSGTYGNGVQVLDGATGKPRWSRWFPNSSHMRWRTQRAADQFTVGPDLDGDGQRELFKASIRSEFRPRLAREGNSHQYEEYHLYVDCFSGRDGQSLWWQRVPLGLTEYAAMTGEIGEMLWWGSGANEISRNALASGSELRRTSATDKPDASAFRLMIPVHRHPDTQQDGGTHSIYILSAATGRVEHHADDLALPQLVDWNNDGLDDLAVFVPDDPVRFQQRHSYPDTPTGKFVVLRGSPPEAFRRLERWTEEQDFDGDGIAELSRPMGGMGVDYAVEIASGRDGHIQSRWKADWPETPRSHTVGELHSFPLPLGDFDGDGLADLLLTRESRFWEWEDNPSVILRDGRLPLLMQAISSKTGRRVWGGPSLTLSEEFRPKNADDPKAFDSVRNNYVQSTSTLAVDLDRDGRPELLQTLRLFGQRFPEPRGCAPVEQQQLQLALIDGRNGSLRWIAPMIDQVVSGNSWQLRDGRTQVDATADLNGDGMLDALVLIPRHTPEGSWSADLQAHNGRDGKRLWGPLPRTGTWFNTNDAPMPRIGDLDGDGKPELVLLESKQPMIVKVLSGDTGETQWTWNGALPPNFTDPSVVICRLGTPARPDGESKSAGEDRTGKSAHPTRGVAVTNTNETGNQWELVLLDHAGQVVERVPYNSNQLWSHDLDGDGFEELLRWENYTLKASRGLHDILWTWTRPPNDYGWVSRFDRTADGRVIVVTVGADSLTLLDGLTGQPIGRTYKSTNTSLGENNRTVDLNHAHVAALFENSRLLTRVGDGPVMINYVVSRAVLPADADGRYQRSRHAPRDELNAPTTSNAGSASIRNSTSTARSAHHAERDGYVGRNVADDPRLIRQLPWAPSPAEWAAGKAELLTQAALAISLAFGLVVIPFWLIRAGVRRKHIGWWRAAWIAAAPVVFATTLILFQFAFSGSRWRGIPLPALAAMGVAAFPGLVWIATLLRNLVAGEWRRLSWLLGGSLLAAFTLAVLALSMTASQKPPEQHYSWHAWWFILLFGAQSVGASLVLWNVFGPGVLWMRKAGRRRFARHRVIS